MNYHHVDGIDPRAFEAFLQMREQQARDFELICRPLLRDGKRAHRRLWDLIHLGNIQTGRTWRQPRAEVNRVCGTTAGVLDWPADTSRSTARKRRLMAQEQAEA